jgi:sulfotransferase family protein
MELGSPIFLVGSGRCGTTLLAQLLGAHSGLASLFEVQSLSLWLKRLTAAKALSDADFEVDSANIEFALSAGSGYNWAIGFDEAFEAQWQLRQALARRVDVRTAVRRWLHRYHEAQLRSLGGARVLHKTPALSESVDMLVAIWPDSPVIHLVRDPRAVAASYLREWWGPSSWQEAIDWYERRVGAVLRCASPRILTVRYEDLTARPASILTAIQQFLRLGPETSAMLASIAVRGDSHRLKVTNLPVKVPCELLTRLPELRTLYPTLETR